MQKILDFLDENRIKFRQNVDFSELTSMRCGPLASLLVEPDSISKLVDTVKFLHLEGALYRVVGGMTNTLPPSVDFSDALIHTGRISGLRFTENNRVNAEAGVSLSRVAREAALLCIDGFAELAGIPGSLGGAIFGNAGAHSRAMSDVVFTVSAYDPESDRLLTFSGSELAFGYRHSIFRDNTSLVILSAELSGRAGERESILSQMREYAAIRRERQPLSMPSLGSIFKHPTGGFAPKIIEELGLKGLRVGGAAVSEKHAGFIVNLGTATPDDVKELITRIKDRVFSARGIVLEEEINVM